MASGYKIPNSSRFVFETTPERSKRMSNIRNKNTQPEIILRKALWSGGIRYRINVTTLPGKPDIVIKKKKMAIFVDGEFWHGYNWNSKKERIVANRDYWIPKIERNMERDLKNNYDLQAQGYIVLRFWQHQIKNDLAGCVHLINEVLNKGCL